MKQKKNTAVLEEAASENVATRPTARFSEKVSQFRFQNGNDAPFTPRRSPRKRTTSTRGGPVDKIKAEELPSAPKKKRRVDSLSIGRSPSPSKKAKRGYAPPEVYEHLKYLTDYMALDMDVLFCGINPGKKSAEIGHHFGNPTNHFWYCLFESKLTPRLLPPQEDYTLPILYSLGLTDLVDRPTAEQNELSASEQTASVPTFLAKVARYRPRTVCFIGLDISRTVSKFLRLAPQEKKVPEQKVKSKKSFKVALDLGLQPYKMVHADQTETLFYASPSTSGRVTQYQKKDKVKFFTEVHNIVRKVKSGSFDSSALTVIPAPKTEDEAVNLPAIPVAMESEANECKTESGDEFA